MSRRATYEIVLRGHPSVRLLRPLVDDFAIDDRVDPRPHIDELIEEVKRDPTCIFWGWS